ncbi:MAG TPA: hypothetical protein VFY83_01800, partial [Anaerolineales bacterium]|nr:hypothetical protein [Anaerolineales bacterium]
LDDDLGVLSVEKWEVPQALACLKGYENIRVALNRPPRESPMFAEFKKKIVQAGFKSYSGKPEPRQFLVTSADDCFRALSGHRLFPRRSLEGRLQRSAILYEQGLQITDPIDIFEEFTRYKLIQGILPLEKIHSSKELDALVAAYLAWLAVRRPGQLALQGEFALPAAE